MEILELIDTVPTQGQKFDIFIAALSSESRAINIASKYGISAPAKFAIISARKDELAYKDNEAVFASNKFSIIRHGELDDVLRLLNESHPEQRIRIALDISCMPRQLMAKVLLAILGMAKIDEYEITFFYSLASFTTPAVDIVPNEAIEPVSPTFSGWPSEQSLPTSLITGIGYEPEKAEGASEYLDPSEQWGFIPLSPVSEFLTELEKNNNSLISRITSEGRAIRYEVSEPSRTFGQLEIVISDLLRRSNPILLPFGPKIFFALCLLQGIRHPEVGVWHVTGESNESPVDRRASGLEVGFSVTLAKANQRECIPN
jgi:hypothetical protein